jgi:DNA-binding response OmpR family regulator
VNGARLLVVEDEPRVADMLLRGLGAEGYAVSLAGDGPGALAMAGAGGYAAILLDLMLPGFDGQEVCRRLRGRGDQTPVLMLTAMDGLDDKVNGLLIGADDYLTKPFAFDELLARLAALIRRSRLAVAAPAAPGRLRFADLALDPVNMIAERAGRRVELTGREVALLALLVEAAGAIVRRERILAAVWGGAEDPQANIVDVYVRRLRRKLEEELAAPPLIVTVRGHGYRLDAEAARGAL